MDLFSVFLIFLGLGVLWLEKTGKFEKLRNSPYTIIADSAPGPRLTKFVGVVWVFVGVIFFLKLNVF